MTPPAVGAVPPVATVPPVAALPPVDTPPVGVAATPAVGELDVFSVVASSLQLQSVARTINAESDENDARRKSVGVDILGDSLVS
jgi:hypothetical protein